MTTYSLIRWNGECVRTMKSDALAFDAAVALYRQHMGDVNGRLGVTAIVGEDNSVTICDPKGRPLGFTVRRSS